MKNGKGISGPLVTACRVRSGSKPAPTHCNVETGAQLAQANRYTYVELYGIRFVGLNPENGRKLLVTVALVVLVVGVRWGLRAIARVLIRGNPKLWRGRFWTHQGISVVCAIILTIGIISIWFDNPARLGTFVGLVTAGIAFALQKVITSLAGYFVILRGNTFSVGDRIVMGNVRGDVVALGFMQTTIMEMGQPPPVQSADPAMWVQSRQFTGRVVTISNSEIFDKPVYNYSREFPYIWDEIKIPITYEADRARVESILLLTANRHALNRHKLGDGPVQELHRKYQVDPIDVDPTVYYRVTDNWLELTVRFLAPDHGTRRIKDRMSREIITALDEANIGIASGTYAIVQIPPVEIKRFPQLTLGSTTTQPNDAKPEQISNKPQACNDSEREPGSASSHRQP